MKTKLNHNHTMLGCYLACVSQAIICSFAPLLFLTFQREFALSLEQITLLVTLNFLTQLTVDALCARVVDRIGYRPCIVTGLLCAAAGVAGLAVLPNILPPLAGLLPSVVIYGIGGGIIEVLSSPIAEACPTENKEAAMSLMHSFFCWGCVAVILLSTALFSLLGMENWRFVAVFWAIVPLCTAILFTGVPIAAIVEDGKSLSIGELLKNKLFWILMLLMICSGAVEHSISQWASAFAESGLGVSKTVGDLAGPCFFAVLMGVARVLHARLSDRIVLENYMSGSAVLGIVGFAMVVLAPNPVINLLGCGVCGFACAIMWPGTLSIAAKRCPLGGTAMFALLALGGDVGCTTGPTLVGFVSGLFGDDLKTGIAAAVVFPILILLGIGMLKRTKQ